MNRNEDNESPLLSIEVQLEKETVNLIINEDDIIEEKIKNFCKKYNDNFLFIIILKRIILKQIFYYIYKRIETIRVGFNKKTKTKK